ncbi:hypothetical protein SEPCBS119000_003561 [Sporothrix epigloea]|uniref:Uncharacterized protein n=1 Tax=Sporothrix epigloea TaxID=1892477 RepID=A0ABP0DMA3_9PEZI
MGTKHLTEADRLQVRTLFFNTGLPKARICQITGFSLNQVKLAIREKTPKTRSGRPPRRRIGGSGALPVILDAQVTGSDDAVADGTAVADEHRRAGLAVSSSLTVSHLAMAALPETAVRQVDAWSPRLHSHDQQRQQQSQQGISHMKWDTTAGLPPQHHLYYPSWPPPDAAPMSTSSTNLPTANGPCELSSPGSQLLPTPTTTLLRKFPATVGPQGISSPSVALMAEHVQGRSGSISSSAESNARMNEGYEFSSSSSASSATSYSSTPCSQMPSSSSLGGGFSLTSILSSATGS